MIMLSVYKCMAGNASFALLRQRTKLGLKLQHIGDGIVYIDGIDGSKWVYLQ